MNLSGIISISGQSGLFKIISQTKNGIIVEPLEGGRRFPVHGAQRVSSLEDISIYTYEEDIPLSDVFKNILGNLKGADAPSPKSDPQELKSFMETHLPEYDQDRVYVSDIKKVVLWYNLLKKADLLESKEEEKKEKEGSKKGEKTETKAKKASPKQAPAKGAAKSVAKKTAGPKKTGSTRSK